MSITVQADIVEGQSASNTPEGVSVTRVYKLTTSASETMLDILANASIPQLYDDHPDTGGTGEFTTIKALEITCEPDQADPANYTVTVVYGRPNATQKDPGVTTDDSLLQVGSSVTNDKTSVDKNGDQLSVSLTGQTDQVGEVEIQVPQTILTFERKESTNPISKALTHTGKVNSAALGSGTYAVRTLLCLAIEGTSTDDGDTWLVSYRFQYNPDTWDVDILYIDPNTDRPHDDIDIATSDGITTAQIYGTSDFSSLSLSF